MYNAATINEGFAGLVGWRNPYDPAYPAVPEELSGSASGLYFQDAHPLITLENLWSSAPEFDKYDYPENPAAITTFYNWLKAQQQAAIVGLLSEMTTRRKLADAGKTLLENRMLFDGMGNYNDRIIKRGRFVYIELRLKAQKGLKYTIPGIGLQIDTPQQGLPIYVYSPTSYTPVEIIPVNITKPLSVQWVEFPEPLVLEPGSGADAGGYFVGYYEDDLVGQAINRATTWGQPPCFGCSGYSYESYIKYSKYMAITAGSVSSNYFSDFEDNLFDVSGITANGSTNWGMNLKINVACDLTTFFLENKALFPQAIAHAVAVKLLSVIAYSTRVNALQDKTRALAMMDIDATRKDAFIHKYNALIDGLNVDFSGINAFCMPCTKKGLRLGAV